MLATLGIYASFRFFPSLPADEGGAMQAKSLSLLHQQKGVHSNWELGMSTESHSYAFDVTSVWKNRLSILYR